MRATPRLLAALVALGLATVLGGCGGGGADTDPATVLAEARAVLDGTESVHFALTGRDVPEGGARLLGGEGDLVRPDGMRGELDVSIGGLPTTVAVRSRGGVFEARLPFTEVFAEVDPVQFGFRDPAALLDPETGLAALLTEVREPRVVGEARGEDGTVVDRVAGELPGERVAELLRSADPAAPVEATVEVTREGREVRRVELRGPFYEADVQSTFELLLTGYDEPVDLDAPPG